MEFAHKLIEKWAELLNRYLTKKDVHTDGKSAYKTMLYITCHQGNAK